MTIIFSENEQRANDIKLALSLQAPLIIDERITILELNRLYEWLKQIDKVVEGKLFLDEFLKDIIFKGQSEGLHLYDFKGFTIAYKTTVNSDKTYVFEFN